MAKGRGRPAPITPGTGAEQTPASLLLVIVLTSNRKLSKGGAERQGAAPEKKRQKKRRHLGENSCIVVEVGIKNDAEQRGQRAGLF